MIRTEDILVERNGSVTHIILNRPEVLNAMTASHIRRIIRELLKVWRDPTAGAVLLSGAGRAFSAGHDLREGDLGVVGASVWNQLFGVLTEMPKPTVAAINGVAMGGGFHLALACDLVLCYDEALVGESFVRIGASPDTGGHLLLQRSIGHMRSVEMMMLGQAVPARELADDGLFVSSWPSTDHLMTEAMRIATQLASGPRLSYRVIRNGLEYARLHSLGSLLAWEAEREEEMTKTLDMKEGVSAFLERRRPHFRGQ